MDNYGMRKNSNKWSALKAEIEIVDNLYHEGFTFDAIVEVIAEDCDYSYDEAEIIVSEIMQAAS